MLQNLSPAQTIALFIGGPLALGLGLTIAFGWPWYVPLLFAALPIAALAGLFIFLAFALDWSH